MACEQGLWQTREAVPKARSHLKKPRPRYFFKEWRHYRGLTQAQLADRVDMTESSISQIESGKQGFTDATLEVLADALMCAPGDLLMRNPMDAAAPWSLWETLQPSERRQAIAVIEAIRKTGTGT